MNMSAVKNQPNSPNQARTHTKLSGRLPPTVRRRMKQYLSRDQYRLYKLIWDRFIASSMAPAILDTVKMDLSNNGVIFRSNGQTIKFKGFMQIYIEGNDDGDEDMNSR